jgi:hypothetical protein
VSAWYSSSQADIVYLSTIIEDAADPKDALRPYLHRLSSAPLFESYHVTHHYEAEASPAAVIKLLSPYTGLEGLTEGLDWEAVQGRAAYSAVMGDEETEKEFFEKVLEEGADEGDEL